MLVASVLETKRSAILTVNQERTKKTKSGPFGPLLQFL
jgi:hypothetical protein